MSIADEIKAATSRPGGKCSAGRALAALPPAKRREFEEAMAGSATGSAIAKVLSRHAEMRIAGDTLQRHRNGGCACGDL